MLICEKKEMIVYVLHILKVCERQLMPCETYLENNNFSLLMTLFERFKTENNTKIV